MKSWMIAAALVSGLAIAAPASAAEAAPEAEQQSPAAAPVSNRGVITLPDTDIVGRYNRPQAAMTISRMNARLTLVTLKQMFIERIEQSMLSGPF